MMKLVNLISILFFSTFPIRSLANYRILAPGEKLLEGERIGIINNHCELIMQKDGNLVIQKDGNVTWSTEGLPPGTDGNEFFAKMLKTGDLVVKSNGQKFYSTKTFRDVTLDDDNGGLYFENDCTISIATNVNNHDFIWANVRTNLYGGNRLGKGDMFKYPENNPMFTLYLKHDGELQIFRGVDRSKFDGPNDIVFRSYSFSDKEDFFLQLLCDGELVLKEKVSSNPARYEEYWSLRFTNQPNLQGYSLTLSEFGFAYVAEDECKNERYSM